MAGHHLFAATIRCAWRLTAAVLLVGEVVQLSACRLPPAVQARRAALQECEVKLSVHPTRAALGQRSIVSIEIINVSRRPVEIPPAHRIFINYEQGGARAWTFESACSGFEYVRLRPKEKITYRKTFDTPALYGRIHIFTNEWPDVKVPFDVLRPGWNERTVITADAPVDVIIPLIIEYEPPSGFDRNPHAPVAPEWWRPPEGVLPQIHFNLASLEIVFGERADEFRRAPSWKTLEERAAHPRWPGTAFGTVVEALAIDGRRVLIADYKTPMSRDGPVDYWSRIWIPVAEDVLLEGFVSSEDPEECARLRETFRTLKIHRYWDLSDG